ncbi:Hsp70 family chaperone [Stagonosporopsis vannaccii]|nr:Hsp70 family chaperone [Stagonosporopsis vannaccii]
MASEIVVGIDFGTTHSGVSWAINGGKKTIQIINDWPNPKSDVATSDKVPSTLSYQNRKPHHWGYSVTNKEISLSWFKLLLDPKNKIGRDSDRVLATIKQLEALGKRPEDVAVDYLRLIWQYTKDDIRKHRGDDWTDFHTVRAVLTVPAIWSPGAQDKTLKIARKAGLPDNISLVSEPEAAALAVLREKHEDGDLKIGDCFVVCDAGGGTVDLISYKICSLNPFQVEECAVGDGDLCGSVYLDQAFEKYIKTIVGEDQWQDLRPKSKQKMMSEFETSVKRCYTGDEQEYSVDLPDVRDDRSVGIDDDTITLDPKMLQTIFDHIIGQIMRLVDKQIDEVADKGSNVKAILLVGGFGTNRYMHKKLSEAHKSAGTKVLQVSGGWSSICRGATIWGLERSQQTASSKKTVRSRIARYSYGIPCTVPFDESQGHQLRDRIRGSKGEWRAANQMSWMLRKGEKIEEGRRIHQGLTMVVPVNDDEQGMHNLSNGLWVCADDTPPERQESSVKELCKVEFGIQRSKLWQAPIYRSPLTNARWRDAVFDLWLRLDKATLEFSVEHREEKVAWTEAKYKENF